MCHRPDAFHGKGADACKIFCAQLWRLVPGENIRHGLCDDCRVWWKPDATNITNRLIDECRQIDLGNAHACLAAEVGLGPFSVAWKVCFALSTCRRSVMTEHPNRSAKSEKREPAEMAIRARETCSSVSDFRSFRDLFTVPARRSDDFCEECTRCRSETIQTHAQSRGEEARGCGRDRRFGAPLLTPLSFCVRTFHLAPQATESGYEHT